MEIQERQYAALAPLLAFAGIFAHPVASTVLPLILFFLFRWWNKPHAAILALRTADLAFTVQLSIIISSLLLLLYMSFMPLPEVWAQRIMTIITMVFLSYFVISLILAIVLGIRGEVIKYWISFRIAERVFAALNKNQRQT